MQSKSLLIAIAAFAVTTTGVHAYGGSKVLTRAGVNKEQVQAFEDAKELRDSGNFKGARDRLLEAGIDEETLKNVNKARRTVEQAIHEAVESRDYEAFKLAIADSPLADIITSESDFEQFVEAHELKKNGNWEEAETAFNELGIDKPENGLGKRFHRHGLLSELSDEQREAFRVARQSNDRETMRAILDEAGIENHKLNR